MLKKSWEFIKDNVAAIITMATAVLTVVYAALRLCVYAYWKGYFTRLNIDASIMNLNFDKSIFAVIFVAIILFVVFFFMKWVFEIITDIKNKEKEQHLKGKRKILYKLKAFGKGLSLSLMILLVVNVPLIMLLVSVIGINVTISNTIYLYLLLYIMEMLFIFTHMTPKQHKEKEKSTEKDIAFKIMEIFLFVIIILATSFYVGNQAIEKKTSVQLVENEEYMISYCDGEHYVLHKVQCTGEEIVVYKNEQKIVGIENNEISIKMIKEIYIRN